MEWLTEPFELAFQQRALVAGVLAALALSVVGTWVVIRGMTFLGDALVHGVVPGIAIAIIFDFNVLIGAVLAAVAMIGGINFVHRQTTFSEDTGIGLLFVGMLGLGVILISRTDSFAVNLSTILFGDALGVTGGD
ncbi:MAG: metal ABC transporter permease, partial [Acidimicrobiia bacterium]